MRELDPETKAKHDAFVAAALRALESFKRERMGYGMEEVLTYFEARANGLDPPRPTSRKW